MEKFGSLSSVIETLPKEEQEEVLKIISYWLGGVELTPEVEDDPQYQRAILGAVNLMRDKAFDWPVPNETDSEQHQRWLKNASWNSLSYGIRFSRTKPLMVTVGVTDGQSLYYSRFHFSDQDGMFIPEKQPNLMLTFKEALDYRRKTARFPKSKIYPLDLNKYRLVKQAFNNYITVLEDLHDQSTAEDWSYSLYDNNNSQVGGSLLIGGAVMGVLIIGAAAGLFMWSRGKKKVKQFANMAHDMSEYKAPEKRTYGEDYVGKGGPAAFVGPRMGSNCSAYAEKMKCNSNPPCQWIDDTCRAPKFRPVPRPPTK